MTGNISMSFNYEFLWIAETYEWDQFVMFNTQWNSKDEIVRFIGETYKKVSSFSLISISEWKHVFRRGFFWDFRIIDKIYEMWWQQKISCKFCFSESRLMRNWWKISDNYQPLEFSHFFSANIKPPKLNVETHFLHSI